MHTLDHTEQEQETLVEQAQVKDNINIFSKQGKHWCIPLATFHVSNQRGDGNHMLKRP
jgi:hypothetical protein